jgi:hypothetical protein
MSPLAGVRLYHLLCAAPRYQRLCVILFPTRRLDIPKKSLATRHSPLATNSPRINTSTNPRICIKTNHFNPFRIRTSKLAHLTLKTNDFNSNGINTYTICYSKPFRIRTSKKRWGEGVKPLSQPDRDVAILVSCRAVRHPVYPASKGAKPIEDSDPVGRDRG